MKYNIEVDESYTVPVDIYDQTGFGQIAECGARRLFEIEEFVFMDSVDAEDKEYYLIGISVWNNERLDFFISLELKDFYELVALIFNVETKRLLHQWLHKMLACVFALSLKEKKKLITLEVGVVQVGKGKEL